MKIAPAVLLSLFGLSVARAEAPVASMDVKAPEAAPPAAAPADPFSFADFGWLNGNSRQSEFPLDSKVFTGEFTFDGNYIYDFAHPSDHTLIGSTNAGRTSEFQVEQLGIGGDFHYKNVRGRVMTQFGLYSVMTPRNDASPARGQWNLSDAYRYLSEAYGGYHWDVLHGINLDAGIFMSYVGLCSYYNYENWVYQMSYVSANTPWFFNGLRLQIFPTDRFKVEVWVINGWQSYGMFNEQPGAGFSLLWRPTGSFSLVSNNYFGADTLATSGRYRVHSDNSAQVKYFDNPDGILSKGALSLTADLGCEQGAGVSCGSGVASAPGQYFLGFMVYNRLWFLKDRFGLTVGGGAITNPGRYLVLLPPIDGATASTGTPYFTENPGNGFMAWDASVTLDYNPSQFLTFRIEYIHRQASVPYFAGPGGVTPPGGNSGAPGSEIAGWTPSLAKFESRINAALLVRL
jgi:hypothetical protein